MGPNYYQAPPMNKRPSLFNPKMLLIGGGALFAIIIAAILLFSSGDGGVKALYSSAVARQTTLLTILQSSSDRITDADLLKFNADAKLFVMTDMALLQSGLSSYGMKAPSKEAIAAEADTKTIESLDKAAQENRYDDVYIDAVSQKMDSQQALLQELYQSAHSAARPDIETAYQNMQTMQERLQKIKL